jgi:hypothetical protein
MLHYSRVERLARDKHSSLFWPNVSYGQKSLVITGSIHDASFYLYFMNGPNKAKCYITIGWKGLPETKTLAYFGQM